VKPKDIFILKHCLDGIVLDAQTAIEHIKSDGEASHIYETLKTLECNLP
jgi:hypothetical protein